VDADQLDEMMIDQLHAATLKASDSCFELKKACATLLVPVAALVAVFTDKVLTPAVFWAALGVIVPFWLADVVSFRLQRQIRVAMQKHINRRKARLPSSGPIWKYSETTEVGPLQAAFDRSMAFYGLLALPIALTMLAFALGLLDYPAPK